MEDLVTAYGWKALAGSVIGYAMDGFDLLIVGFMLPVITAELALTSPQAGSLVTWTLMGAVAGGLIFGSMSDHFGRIKVLTWTLLVFAGFTGLCALARGYWDLAAYRMIAGLGLGGEFGIGMALAAEAWPASKRARVSSLYRTRVAIGSSPSCVRYTCVTSSDWVARDVHGRPVARARGLHCAPNS